MIPPDIPEPSREFTHDLSREVEEVRFDRLTRLLYSTDASIYQMVPLGVAFPRDADQVAAAVSIAARHRVPILPRGSGSSLDGQAVGHALVLDFTRHMDRVLEIDFEGRRVRTQPGLTLGLLNQQLRRHGLMYGPDPASAERATLGGVLGNNSTGAHSVVYGMTVDHTLECEAVLADGSRARFAPFPPDQWAARGKTGGLEGSVYRRVQAILERFSGPIATRYPKTFRTVAGYGLNKVNGPQDASLARLLVGSEGTLAAFTEMTVNLVPVPKATRLAIVHFAELREAMEAVPLIMETGPTAVEVMDRLLLDLTRDRLEYRRLLTFVEGNPGLLLAVEYSGEGEAELAAGIERLRALLERMGHRHPVVIVADPAQQANVWFVRKVGLGILMSVRGDAKPVPFIEDAAVPLQHLADYATQIHDFCLEVGVPQVAIYAHASAGCLHIRPLVNLKQAQGLRQMRQIAEKSIELVVQFEGSTSGEHGEGLARGEFSERLFGPELVQAFREVKAAFDPQGLLNPGKVVGVARMDDESLLRYGTGYSVPLALRRTALNFESEMGFDRAVEMCNGAGVCRKLGEGVMCPSFMATRDEAHSTRGRANALRAAMMGLLGPEGMTSADLYGVLDLCLSCQACRRECPSAVDMAKLKAEFLHGYQARRGIPLRSRLFARVAGLNRLAQAAPGLANPLLRGPGRWALAAVGVHPARRLPRLARQSFSRWFEARTPGPEGESAAPPPSSSGRDRPELVFFHDTFTEHHEPHIGEAAVRLLEACGYRPILVRRLGCCGRPAYSKGLLDLARSMAMRNLAQLEPYARAGTPIVGVEPSCISMLTGEYRDLVPGAAAEAVASASSLLEDFLLRAGRALPEFGDLRLDDFPARSDRSLPESGQSPRPLLYHGHCHQKANFGTEAVQALLSRVPGVQLQPIESSCCGMAGSFGYEREHYDLSVKLAELALAPAVRAAPQGALICASGTSCREQIHHTTGRRALHPVEVLAAALPGG
jgi:FAD/FMN-containing dehydrogenase/Fe-S oxidoreductase